MANTCRQDGPCEWEKDFTTLARKVGGLLGAEKFLRDRAALLAALARLLAAHDLNDDEEPERAMWQDARAAIAQAKGGTA